MEDTFATLLLALSAGSCLFLAAVVYVKNPEKRTHRAFAALAACLGLWALGVMTIIHARTEETARFWIIATFIVATFIPLLFNVFVGIFPRQRYEGFRPLLYLLIVATPLMIAGAFTPYYLTSVTVHATARPEVEYGPAFYVFAGIVGLTMMFSYPILIRKLKDSSGAERLQIEHILLGIFVSTTLGVSTNVVGPVLGIGSLEAYGPIFSVLMMGIFAYAMVRYHLLDIWLIVSRTTVYAVSVAFIILTFFGVVSLLHLFLRTQTGTSQHVIPAMLAALIIVLVLQPLKECVQLVLDRTLLKERYDTYSLVTRLNQRAAEMVQLDELLETVGNDIQGTVGAGSFRALLITGRSPATLTVEYSSNAEETGSEMHGCGVLVEYAGRNPEPMVLGKILHTRPTPEEARVAQCLAEMDCSLCVPLKTTSGLVGFLALGQKRSRQIYTANDLTAFSAIATPLATAIENARLYRKLEEVNLHLAQILRNMRGGVVAVDSNGVIRTVNKGARAMLGPVEMGHSLDVLPGEMAHALESTMKEHKPLSDIEMTVPAPDGEELHLVVSTSLLAASAGSPVGAMAMLYDLTQLKRLERNVQRADHLSSIGTLAAGMAHEIKNPLVSIKTFSQLLMSRYEDEDFRSTFATVVPHEVERIDMIVSQLLDFARPRPVEFATQNLTEIVRNVLALVDNQASKAGIALEVSFPQESLLVHGDEQQLHQLFLNLLLNAMEAVRQNGGGEIGVEAQMTRAVLRPDGSAPMFETDCVRVELTDSGIGIPPDALDKLFTPFYTTRADGTGLGLTVVHGIICEHGGDIDVASQPGRGTKFTVTLPLAGEVVSSTEARS